MAGVRDGRNLMSPMRCLYLETVTLLIVSGHDRLVNVI